MKYKLICCEVFTREACISIFESKNTVDVEFTKKASHEFPENLNKLIQQIIDKTEAQGGYDAVLLGFGLCGNAALGLKSKSIPLVIPRAHDCCTIFLGSKQKFLTYFKDNLSKVWSSTGYMERGDSYIRQSETGKLLGLDRSYEEFVEKYGEEDAKYIWETLHPDYNDNELVFIDIPETSKLGYLDILKETAKKESKTVRVIPGDMKLIKNLVNGDWNQEEFLVVPPSMEIKPAYDYDEVVKI